MRRALATAFAAALLASASPAAAFHEVSSFARTADGGGGGYYFTGSPRFKGYDCTICHNDGAGAIAIEMVSNPPELAAGSYAPGVSYEITLRMLGEHRGLESAFNPNTFTMDIVDDERAALGAFSAFALGPVQIADDGHIAVAEGRGNGEAEWTLTWTAPDGPPRPATIHIAMLDGDGASEADRRIIDIINDDVAVGTLRLCPDGGDCPPRDDEPPDPDSAVQCAAGGRGLAAWLALAVALALIALRRRRPC